ncbi:MAG TPA: ABC transporter permease subunit [Candidatus Acidoferrales bacterium]|nr:ABC transporter permease subunit [Candidatus Acidoferrales bacterium]
MLDLRRIGAFFHFIGQFFPPDLSYHYLSYLGTPIAETLAMAVGSIFLAVLVAIPLSLVIGTRMPGSRLLYAALAGVRSIPDLTMAIFCVIVVGLGRGAGLVALIVYYSAAMAKVFGEIFLAADPRPLEALRATGASRISLAAFGLIPVKLSDAVTYGIYELESAMRASVIVGAVGAGGIGAELVGSLNDFHYRRITTLILVLVALIVLVDRFCWLARRHPAALAVLPPAGVVSVVFCWPQIFAFRHALTTFATMLPPYLTARELHRVPALVVETLGIAAGGTLCAAVLAVLVSPAAARGIAPRFVVVWVRRLFDFARATPEIVWGLLFVTFVVGGPWAGVLALGLHSFGVLGKLFAESLENVPVDPIRALEATGASRMAVAAFGNYPLGFGPIIVHALFRFEWNVRAATVLGLIGAGGIGEALFDSQEMFFYRQMFAYLLITCLMIGTLDFLSTKLRKRYRVSWEAIE